MKEKEREWKRGGGEKGREEKKWKYREREGRSDGDWRDERAGESGIKGKSEEEKEKEDKEE